eukprot:TRINITY_DN61694_c0_g1_i1.p1 TRINITY_DN61694_c0_g1~~TRINITY_DN61694_c0_g1_i1.p1  ORF type:complete len:438 (-),score=68.61 TRINITY_DN61694_c0_g1_i1:122-1435(-)
MVVKRKRAAKTKASAADEAADDVGDLHSDEEDSDEAPHKKGHAEEQDEDDDEFFETADEKRVRLAKQYLKSMEESGKTLDQVQDRLSQDVVEQERKAKFVINDFQFGEARFMRGHRETATCVVLSQDERTMFTGGKDCSVLRWDVETGQKDRFKGAHNKFDCGGHFSHVLGLCLLEDKQLLLSVGTDRVLRMWDARTPAQGACIEKLLGHSAAITSIVADPDGRQVYTASLDKSVKIWDLSAKRCTETLLGHVGGITSMDQFIKGRPVTASADKTVRQWKIDKDTHLMFNKHTYAVDAVTVLDHDRFISGSQDGSLNLWTPLSKKPLAGAQLGAGRWVSCLGAVKCSNIFFTGDTSGALQAWSVSDKPSTTSGKREGVSIAMVPSALHEVTGVINGIAVGQRFVACAIGKHHRLGSWFKEKKAKHGVVMLPMSFSKG